MANDLFFQIVLFLVGAIIGVVAQILKPLYQKILAGVLAIICIAVASMWLGYQMGVSQVNLPTPSLVSVDRTCAKYGLKIVSPSPGFVNSSTQVSGTYQNAPSDSSLWVFTVYRDTPPRYRPQQIATMDHQKKIWYSDLDISGTKGDTVYLAAVLVGKEGRVLVDYHMFVGNQTKIWPPITQFTNDMVECDAVQVTVR